MRLIALLLNITILLSTSSFANTPPPQVSKGKLETIQNFNSDFVPDRDLTIWLPSDYTTTKKYDVLYMHDGRMLFDASQTWNKQEWQVDEVAGKLIEQARIRPIIVVGIPNAKENRHSEFYPQQAFESLSDSLQEQLYQLEKQPDLKLFASKVYSDNYGRFLVEEVIPFIESHYSVNKGGQHRYLAGSSMGGLISWYTLLNYPTEFAGAICMSTHWPGIFTLEDEVFASFKTYIDKNLSKLTSQKIYFDYGDATLDAMYPDLQKQINQIFEQHNYPKDQWKSEYFPGADHSENAWAKRLHVPLEFMLKPTH